MRSIRSESTECGGTLGFRSGPAGLASGSGEKRCGPRRRRRPIKSPAYDFVHDACANGQQLKMLTVVDEYTRYCLAIEVAGRLRSGQVIEVLARLMSRQGAPQFLRSDQGPEFIARAIKRSPGGEAGQDDLYRAGEALAAMGPTSRLTGSCATNA